MSTWISDPSAACRALAAGLAALALSGCVGGGPEATSGFAGFAFSRAAPKSVTVADDTVAIAGPRGFCVEDDATRDGADGAFVLMASCAAVSGRDGAPLPATDALLTASVAARPGPGGRPEDRALMLERFFSSQAGRAALARDGRAESVEVDRMFDRDGLFFLHATDRSAGLLPGLRNDYWRAIFEVNGRIVTASVVGFEARPVGDEAGLAVLASFAERIRAASAGLDAAPGLAAAQPSQPAATARPRGIFGFLRR